MVDLEYLSDLQPTGNSMSASSYKTEIAGVTAKQESYILIVVPESFMKGVI